LTEQRKSWLALATLFLLLLVLAALRPLAVPDEGRYGEIGRWMLYSGDWLTPRLNGIPFFHKPPLLYWLEAALLALFGVNAWAARLAPACRRRPQMWDTPSVRCCCARKATTTGP